MLLDLHNAADERMNETFCPVRPKYGFYRARETIRLSGTSNWHVLDMHVGCPCILSVPRIAVTMDMLQFELLSLFPPQMVYPYAGWGIYYQLCNI